MTKQHPDLEADMKASSAIRDAAGDDAFAQALYAALCNTIWRKAGSEEHWHCSWRYAGGVVANLRGKGEDYLHFYCSGIGNEGAAPEGVVLSDVANALALLSWHPLSAEKIAADHEAAVARITELLALPEAKAEEWYRNTPSWQLEQTAGRSPALDTWGGRLTHLARTGRVSEDEWHHLLDRLDFRRQTPNTDLGQAE
jgi:hypothetical protein